MKVYYNRIKLQILYSKCNFDSFFNEKSHNKLVLKSFSRKNLTNIKNYFTFLIENYSNFIYKKFSLKLDFKNIKKIMSLFFIVKFKNNIFSNKTEYNSELLKISKALYKLLKSNTILSSIKFLNLLGTYITKYNLWSILDKRINTYGLLKLYHSNIQNKLDIPKEAKEYTLLCESIDNDQKEIIKCVEYMNDKNEVNFFNAYKDNLEFTKDIDDKLYFIEVKYRLTKEEPDNLVFVELINKTKELLFSCVPNRKDIHKTLNEKLDSGLIEQYLQNNIYDTNYFLTIINTIIEYVKKFQSPDHDSDLEKFKIDCYNKLENNQFYKIFIPMFFMEVFSRLRTVIKQRQDFFKLINKN